MFHFVGLVETGYGRRSNAAQLACRRQFLRGVSRIGILLEFSTSFISGYAQDFGIVDLEGVHLLGTVQGNNIFFGCTVVMYDCGVDEDTRPFYKFRTCI